MKKLVFKLYQVSLLLLICWGAHAWFTWSWDFESNVLKFVIYSLFALVAFAYKSSAKIRLRTDVKTLLVAFLFVLASFICIPATSVIISSFAYFIPLWVLLSDSNVGDHLHFISIALAILILPGFILHVAFLSGLSYPGVPIQYGETFDSYYFYNYFVCIRNLVYSDEGVLTRFNSFFLEPAYLGTMLAFLLYAGKYNLKRWYNVLLLIYLIATFSLAGIILAFVGYLLAGKDTSVKGKRTRNSLVVSGLLVFVVYIVAINYNGGDNLINKHIVQRLQFTNDDKIIAGNNRFTEELDYDFSKMIKDGNLLLGNRSQSIGYAGAGYKKYLLKYGLAPALVYLLMYYVLGTYSRNKKYGLVLVFLVFLTFLQAAYPSSFSWIIPFILAVRNDI